MGLSTYLSSSLWLRGSRAAILDLLTRGWGWAGDKGAVFSLAGWFADGAILVWLVVIREMMERFEVFVTQLWIK